MSCDITRYDTSRHSIVSISRKFGTGIEMSHTVEIFFDFFPSLILPQPQPLLFVIFFGVFVTRYNISFSLLSFFFFNSILNVDNLKHWPGQSRWIESIRWASAQDVPIIFLSRQCLKCYDVCANINFSRGSVRPTRKEKTKRYRPRFWHVVQSAFLPCSGIFFGVFSTVSAIK